MTSNQMVNNDLYGIAIDEKPVDTYTSVDERNKTRTDVTNIHTKEQQRKLSSLTGNVTFTFNFKA